MKTETLTEQENKDLQTWQAEIRKQYPFCMFGFDYRTELLTVYRNGTVIAIFQYKQPR